MKMFAKTFVTLLAIIAAINLSNAATIKAKPDIKEGKESWDLVEALGAASKMRSYNGTWITDEELYFTAPDRSIQKYNAASNTTTEFVNSNVIGLYGSGSTFKLSPDNKKILIRYDAEQIFRHSSIAKFDVYDLETKNVVEIHNNKKLQYCGWSTLNERLAYVYENNVYVHLEDGKEIQLTNDGVTGVIYNGIPDWVYEEEVLSTDSALWWSPDGKKLAVGNFNDTNVKTFQYTIYADGFNFVQYPKEDYLKYPKPGTPNPVVELRVYDLSNPSTTPPKPVVIKAPTEIVTDDHILQEVAWSNNENVVVLWLNRRQNLGTLQNCKFSGQCNEVKRFEEPNGWITLSSLKCLNKSESCIFRYWIGNWRQVWNLDLKTGNNLWKSRGDFTVTALYGYDETNDKLYYQATLRGEPYVSHVFSNDECLTCNLLDVDNKPCRSASASFSKQFSYYSVTCQGPTPRYSRVYKTQSNSLVTDWESNKAFRDNIANKVLPLPDRFMNVTLGDGSVAIVRLKLPHNFDETKSYPMIVNSYGGPDSARVTSAFSIGFEAYMTTTHGVIYATIDGRGTGNQGKDFLFSVNNKLGLHETEDQISVTKYLQKLPYVDRDRTGIWGWSYGGYLTAKVLGNDTERVFQCGISVAPVTSWLFYDTIYTERYMGLPTKEDNLANYVESSVFMNTQNFRNHEFLLIHGSADDNVHYQQSMMFAKVLEQNDILFEQMTYVDENHSIGSFSPHLYHTMEHFWINYLSLDTDEEG